MEAFAVASRCSCNFLAWPRADLCVLFQDPGCQDYKRCWGLSAQALAVLVAPVTHRSRYSTYRPMQPLSSWQVTSKAGKRHLALSQLCEVARKHSMHRLVCAAPGRRTAGLQALPGPERSDLGSACSPAVLCPDAAHTGLCSSLTAGTEGASRKRLEAQ